MPADLSRISVTAKLAAYYRQFSDIAFAREVARRIGADDAFEQIVREHGLERDKLTFYAPMFEARYKSISQLIGKSGCSQVLELASGYSLRGLDLTQVSAVRYVEADLPDVVATKLTLLDDVRRQHGIPPSPLHVVTVADALDLEAVRTAAGGLDHGLPLMVLCEGLIGYLTRQETERLASNVRALLGAFGGGLWICPDFSFKAEVGSLPPERVRLREAITGVTQRQLDASAFEDDGDLTAFLVRAGFDVRVRSQIDETPELSSVSALGLSPAWAERMRPLLRVWIMTPRSTSCACVRRRSSKGSRETPLPSGKMTCCSSEMRSSFRPTSSSFEEMNVSSSTTTTWSRKTTSSSMQMRWSVLDFSSLVRQLSSCV